MCGIVGAFRALGLAPEVLAAVPRATGMLSHRGPDDEGFAIVEGGIAALGVRRLAIVDSVGGAQPMVAGGVHVALNGEIYNHGPLRKELEAGGARLYTRSDTEVVAALFGRYPARTALERLQGMFALSVVAGPERRLWLARDRMGQKPLYWTRLADGSVAWASEPRALLALPGVPRRADRRALQAYLLFEYVPTPWTAWEGISKLEPGTCLEVGPEGVEHWRWWTPPVPRSGSGGSLKKWAQSIRGSLEVAVASRMEADVEVGYLLSGGLDSTAVTALAQARSRGPVRTFSIAVDAPGFDEGPAARLVAAALGTAHREARLGPDDLPRLLDAIATNVDEPLADSSLVAMWRLMELVREAGLRCVQSGDGADESFAGYPTYLAHKLAPAATSAKPLIRLLAGRLPTTWEGVTRDYMARRFADGLGLPWQRRHQVWMGAWLPDEIGVNDEVWTVVDAHARAAVETDPVSRAMYLDQRLYLSDGVLVKVDRASMAHGIEVRSPFLDHNLVELAADLPVAHKLRGRTTKLVLRRAVADLVPTEVLERAKHGFGTPVGPWLRGPCRHLLDEIDEIDDLVPGETLRRVKREHLEGTVDHRRRLWSALVLGRWRRGPWGA